MASVCRLRGALVTESLRKYLFLKSIYLCVQCQELIYSPTSSKGVSDSEMGIQDNLPFLLGSNIAASHIVSSWRQPQDQPSEASED